MRIFISVVIAAFFCVGCFPSSVSASHLKNYDKGHFAVDAGGTLPFNLHFSDFKNPKKATSYYFGGTAGLGGNTALNYRLNQYRTTGPERITVNQLNLMHKVIPQVSAYAGYVNTNTNVNDTSGSVNSGQIGLQARFDIPLLFTVWGQAGIGNKLNSWEIGISKPLLNNFDLNLSYYDNNFRNLTQGGNARARGINAGVTVKF